MLRAYKILRWFVLAGLLFSVFLALKQPGDVTAPMAAAPGAPAAQAFSSKLQNLEDARQRGEPGVQIRLSAEEVNGALAQSLAIQAQPRPATATTQPDALASQQNPVPAAPVSPPTSPTPAQQVPIKDVQVAFAGDQARAKVLTQVYGKDVYITVSGRLGCREGYVTFDPTGFQIGDLTVPVALVNPALQRKLAEPATRDQLKLPDFISDLRVEDGQLVVVGK